MADFPDFEAFVAIYEREAEPLTGPFARRALALAGLPRGARVIDVAAGTGALALAAAEAGARVTATDVAPGMVARLAARLAAFPDCAAQVMSADALQAGDGAFDAAFSIFGAGLLPIWEAGLAELARVTAPGGRVVVAVWPGDNGAAPMRVLREVFTRLFPDRPFEMPLKAWTRDELAAALTAAGCTDVAVHEVASTFVKPDPATLVEDSLPMYRIAPPVQALSDADFARLRAPLIDAFSAYAGPDGVRLPVEAWVAAGTRASTSASTAS